MSNELIIALLSIGCISALAAFFVAWAKADEWKKTAADEHANYIAALGLHNTTAKALEQSKMRDCQGHIDFLNFCVDTLGEKNDALQDKLSAILCPHNDHVWKYGRCVKCGRAK